MDVALKGSSDNIAFFCKTPETLSRIMGCCSSRVIREGVLCVCGVDGSGGETMAVCLDMTVTGTLPPPAMENDTGKVKRT